MLLSKKYVNTILFSNFKRHIFTKSCNLMCTHVNKVAHHNTDSKEYIPIFK